MPNGNGEWRRSALKPADWIAIAAIVVTVAIATAGYVEHRFNGAATDRRDINIRLARIEGALNIRPGAGRQQ